MKDKILRARQEAPYQLSNSSCLKYSGDECSGGYKLETYDLRDRSVRKLLIDLEFICNIAGHRFKLSEEDEQFERRVEEKICQSWDILKVFCRKNEIIQVLPFDPWEFIVAAETKCFNKKHYPFEW